ncbi:MAG: DUF551 domain-containing protein [Bacteroidetes bacterium]|nr:DUF551 domain-containing protein [Bacteroidota bacterium]
MEWNKIEEVLPEDEQLVLAYLPENWVPTPGDPTEKTLQPIKMLRFNKDFYGAHKPRHKNSSSDHFWSGEGLSNHFFQEVTHWMPLPVSPK